MTDKVQKIKEWISKEQGGLIDAQGNFEYTEHEGAYHILCNLDAYIDTLQEEPVSEDFEKIVEEIAEPTILNAYGTKELARRLRNTICGTSVNEDLELTCKDIEKICLIAKESHKFYGFWSEIVYDDILKRFKKLREEKL